MSRPRKRPPLSRLTLSIASKVKSRSVKKSRKAFKPLSHVVESFLEGWCEGIYDVQSTEEKS